MLKPLFWSYAPLALVFVVSAAVLGLAHFLLLVRRKDLGSEARLPRQLILLGMTLLAVVAMITVSPLPESTQNQILALLGLLLSGVVALSSAPFVTNFMATVMLRVTRPFTVGDFIRVGEHYGKVSARGLFDTEIQTENRELIAIPNASFINQAVSVVRSSGMIVATNVSLGYDLPYNQLEPLMLEAAEATGLVAPYVHITELGDYAVRYRVCGLLLDVESALTARSELNRNLLHTLHGAGIEIVSPSVTRHITHSEDTRIIPEAAPADPGGQRVKAEEIVFDKARELEQLEQARRDLKQRISDLRGDKESTGDSKAGLLQELAGVEENLQELQAKS